MSYKNNIKQRNETIQGLRSFKDTLPTSIKKIIKKRGHVFSETLSNWRYIVGNELFKVCYPKSFKNSNKFGVSTLFVMVRRGKEVELEYSKKQIIDKMNTFFGYSVVEKIKLVSFDNFLDKPKKDNTRDTNVTNSKYMNKLLDIKNDKIKKSLIEFTKLFKQK
jgi:hypothetical protein